MIDRYEDIEVDDSSSSSQMLRLFDKRKCILCCRGQELGLLHLITTLNVNNILREHGNTDFALLARLESSHDALAGEVLYHRDFMRNLRRAVHDDVKNGNENLQ